MEEAGEREKGEYLRVRRRADGSVAVYAERRPKPRRRREVEGEEVEREAGRIEAEIGEFGVKEAVRRGAERLKVTQEGLKRALIRRGLGQAP
jgi:hypothetical protein